MLKYIQKFTKTSTISTSILQLSLPFSIYLGIQTGAGWMWWAAALFMYMFVYSLIGNNVAMHRYFTHGHFQVSKPVEWFFLWCGSMTGLGEPLSYAMTHIIHHKYPDTELDPHGPKRGKRSILVYFQKTVDPAETPVFSRRLVELNNKYGWLHRYYLLFVLANAAIMWAIDFKVFLFLWLLPSSMACWGIAWAVYRQHWHGVANNSRFHKIDFLYEGLHKNHHDWPSAPDTAVHSGEIDWTYRTAQLFAKEFDYRGQPSQNEITKISR